MPTTLPVPSKGALRHLRKLALGTSCTVAFSAGLLTEDRRRRIHAAREVHDNAQKLKSSRKYHSTGTATLESIEEVGIRYREDAFWLPSNVGRSKIFVPNLPADAESSAKSMPSPISAPSKTARDRAAKHHPLGDTWMGRKPLTLPQTLSVPQVPKAPKQKIHNRQHKLAIDVERLLEGGEEQPDIDAAASRFFDVFEEGIQVEDAGLLPALVDAALKLSEAGFEKSKFDIPEKVLLIMSRHGPVDEAQFHKFQPAAVIGRLIKGPSQIATGKPYVNTIQLKAAGSIYLTPFQTKPMTTMSEELQSLGDRLCAATCHARMYDLTLEIYARLERQRGDGRPRAINHLITATHAKGQHAKVFRYFKNFYTQTSPDQLQFYHVGDKVIDSVLTQRNDFEIAEQFLAEAAKMAEAGNIRISTTWLLKVLGQEWRTKRDIVRTRAMFDRMVPQLRLTKHPQAVYGAIIQFCIEAGQESVAMAYYHKLAESYMTISSDVRIQGHLALAKALRNNWSGVKEDLRSIGRNSQNYPDEYSSIFTPILKAFVQSHSVQETEVFIRTFIVECQLRITTTMFNMMVGIYCKSREIDSMTRWIDYSISAGCYIDAVTINTILNNCFCTWKYSFAETFQLYQKICQLDCGLVTRFTDRYTISMLRDFAVSSASNAEEARKNLRCFKSLEIVPAGVDPHEIHRRMLHAYAGQRPVDVLRIYKRARADNTPLDEKHLVVAVKASLDLHGANLDEPASLIWSAQKNVQGVCAPVATVIVHQMESLDESGTDASQISKMARDAITSLEGRGVRVSPVVATHAMSILVRRGRYLSTLELWDSISRHFKRPSSSVDLPTLTVLLKAYIGLREQNGVKWAIKMLSENNLVPDKHFRLLLKETRKEARKIAKTQASTSKVHGFLDAIEIAFQQVKEMRVISQEEKKHINFKTIRIIEKALEDQAAREASLLPVPAKTGGEYNEEAEMKRGQGAESASRWTESEESGYEFSLPPARLAGVSAV